MAKHNPANERIKREYFIYLKHAKRHSESTVDASAKAISRFEAYNRYRDFKMFRPEQAIGFKQHFAEERGQKSGECLSKSTLYATLQQLKRFFQWLGLQSGYKSRIQHSAQNTSICQTTIPESPQPGGSSGFRRSNSCSASSQGCQL